MMRLLEWFIKISVGIYEKMVFFGFFLLWERGDLEDKSCNFKNLDMTHLRAI